MAVSTTFLATCRTAILATPERTVFLAAYALYDAASLRADKARYWQLAFNDAQAGMSPAYRLKKAVRDAVLGNADSTMTAADKESAYQTLSAEYVPDSPAPKSAVDEAADLQTLLTLERLK